MHSRLLSRAQEGGILLNSVGRLLQLFSLFLGFGLCFFGYRIYKLAGFTLGFAAGFLLGYPLASSLIHHAAAGLIGGVLLGVLLGMAFRLFRRLGIFLFGAVGFGLIGGTLGGGYVGLGAALAGGGIATLYPRPFVIAGTAFFGAFAAVVAGWSLTPGAQATAFLLRDLLFSAQPGLTRTAITILGLTLVVGGAGAVIQFSMGRPPVPTTDVRQTQPDPRTPHDISRHEDSESLSGSHEPAPQSSEPSVKNEGPDEADAPEQSDRDSNEGQSNPTPKPVAALSLEQAYISTAEQAEPAPRAAPAIDAQTPPQVEAPEMLRLTCTRCTQRVVLDRLAAWEQALEQHAAQACVIDASGRMLARATAIRDGTLPREIADPIAAQKLLGVSTMLERPTVVQGAHGKLLIELAEIPIANPSPAPPEQLKVPYTAECHTIRTEFISPSPEKIRVIAQRWERMSPEYRVSLLTIRTKAGDPFGRALLVSRNALRRLEELSNPIQEAMGVRPPVDLSFSTRTDYGMLYIEVS